MLIEKQEELKTWLTTHLEPLCDADPAALAKYVLALIKKDKPENELKDSMVSQMDVFLQSETKSFVDMLFSVVQSKEYINPPAPPVKEVTEEQVEESNGHSESKNSEELGDPKIEADSTTPIREPEHKLDSKDPARQSFDDGRGRRFRQSPPRDRRLASRLGPRDPPRRFRSRSRSLSPRHDRFRSSRRRSRSPMRRPPSPRRGRSLERRPSSRDSTPTRDEGYTPSAPPAGKKPRCRDYDEKGFCLRGDLCKFDHGTDAVVLEDSTSKQVVGYQPGPGPTPTEPYIPSLPAGIPYPPPVMSVPPPGYQYTGAKRAHEPSDGAGYEPPAKRFDYARLGRGRGRGRGGFRGGRVGGASSMLAVRNIPPELNTITHLNSHFSRYGNLVNVQVQFEGDPGSALVTFGTTDEATAAFNSSEAVMNNRFIKVFWHMDKGHVKDRLGTPTNPNMVLVHEDRITKTISNEGTASKESGEAEDESPEKAKEDKEKAILAIQKNQEMLQTKHELLKKAEEMRKTAMVKQEGLLKSKHDLLDGLIEQQKALIVKLEKGKGVIKAEEKSKIMKLLKDLSASIDRTKEDIKTCINVANTKSRSRTDIQKELLDAEMELFTKQQDGGSETQEIQQKVNNLRIEAARSGILPTSRPPRGRGGYRGRGRGMFSTSPRGGAAPFRGRGRGRGFTISPGNTNLDRRPSRILVSGYELEEKEELIAHFTKFGEIIETVEDEATPSIILKFKTRRFAESAMSSGKNYGERTLTLSWYNQPTPHLVQTEGGTEQFSEEAVEEVDDGYTPPQEDYLPPGLQEHEDNLSQASKGEEEEEGGEELNETGDGANEELNEDLLDDEEEDGEDEERSWKRRNASNEED